MRPLRILVRISPASCWHLQLSYSGTPLFGAGSEKKHRSFGRSFSPVSPVYSLHEYEPLSVLMLHARDIQLEDTQMNATPIVIISGPPGSGKSSVARRLAEQSPSERAVHMHTDDFYRSIRKGYVATWLPEAQEQNIIVLDAFAASATRYAWGGY